MTEEVQLELPDDVIKELEREAGIHSVDMNTYINYVLCSYLAKDKTALLSSIDKLKDKCDFYQLAIFALSFRHSILANTKSLSDVDFLKELNNVFNATSDVKPNA